MLCSECKIWSKSSQKFCQQEKGLFHFIVRINRLFPITVAVRKSDLYAYLRIRRPHALHSQVNQRIQIKSVYIRV